MGVSYTPLPLNTIDKDEGLAWLRSFGLAIPPRVEANRFPTPNEIRTVLKNLEGYQVDYFVGSQTWQATISHPTRPEWAEIVVPNFSQAGGQEDLPHEFYFERGWPELITVILEDLARKWGPFVLVANGENPRIVVPKTAHKISP